MGRRPYDPKVEVERHLKRSRKEAMKAAALIEESGLTHPERLMARKVALILPEIFAKIDELEHLLTDQGGDA